MGLAIESPWDAFNVGVGAAEFSYNVATGNYVGAAISGACTVYDGVATAVSGLPGGASSAYKALKYSDDALGVANSGSKFWTSSTTFKRNKVFQRNYLIDPKLVDARGRRNLERMQKGLAPVGPDGKSINLHHMTQKHNGSIAEVTQTFHQKNSKTIQYQP